MGEASSMTGRGASLMTVSSILELNYNHSFEVKVNQVHVRMNNTRNAEMPTIRRFAFKA